MSVMQLIRRTFPFIMTRILVYALFGLIAFVMLAIIVGLSFLLLKMFGESGGALIIVMIIAFLSVWGLLKFMERYFLYMVKIGHVSVIVELLRAGKVPEGKGMVAYGKDQVVENFGSANAAFVVENMVKAAMRQIQKWIMRIGNVFSFIPGSKNLIAIINAIMVVSLSYIDEAIMSYIFLKNSEQEEKQSVWKSACDGVVLYAQSWKGVIKAAIISVIFIYGFNIIVFIAFTFPLLFISNMIAKGTPGLGSVLGVLALVGAYVLTTMVKRALVDPIVTIIMIRAYQMSIRNLEPKIDMQSKLLSVSSKFKRLFKKSEEEEKQSTVQPVAQDEPV